MKRVRLRLWVWACYGEGSKSEREWVREREEPKLTYYENHFNCIRSENYFMNKEKYCTINLDFL